MNRLTILLFLLGLSVGVFGGMMTAKQLIGDMHPKVTVTFTTCTNPKYEPI